MRIFILVLSFLVVLLLGLWGLDYILPYNFDQMRGMMARDLRASIQGWRDSGTGLEGLKLYEKSNQFRRVYLFQTNITLNGKAYTTAIRLEDDNLRNKGVLVATTNAEVFWIGVRGQIIHMTK